MSGWLPGCLSIVSFNRSGEKVILRNVSVNYRRTCRCRLTLVSSGSRSEKLLILKMSTSYRNAQKTFSLSETYISKYQISLSKDFANLS